jgi:hypothetical protein
MTIVASKTSFDSTVRPVILTVGIKQLFYDDVT